MTTSPSSTSATPPAVGVYVLANDVVLPWFRVFLGSFRHYNRELQLCLIPFDDRSVECERLCTAAGGIVHSDPAAFRALEEIGTQLELGHSSYGPHWFRRYAAFDGPFDVFAYLDCRITVLADVRPFVTASLDHDVSLVHYDTGIDQVYNDGPIRRAFCRDGLGHGFFSGMWASRRGLFSLGQMQAAAGKLVEVRDQMNARNTDQFFINYLCDSNQVRTCHIADLDGTLAHSCWAGERTQVYRDADGVWRRWNFGGHDHRKRLMFMNWAGMRLSPAMPHFAVHAQFREPQPGPVGRLSEFVRGVAGRGFQRLRGNRKLNGLYHTWFS